MASLKHLSVRLMFFVLCLHCCSARKVHLDHDLKRVDHLEPKLMSNVKPKLSESDPRQPHATNDVSVSNVHLNLADLKQEDLEPKLVSKVTPTLSESDPLCANDVSPKGGTGDLLLVDKDESTLSKSDPLAKTDVSMPGGKGYHLPVSKDKPIAYESDHPIEAIDVSTQGGIGILPPHKCDRPNCQPGGYPHVPIPQPPLLPTPVTPCIQPPCHPYVTPMPQPPIGPLPLNPCVEQPCYVPTPEPPNSIPMCGSIPCPLWHGPVPQPPIGPVPLNPCTERPCYVPTPEPDLLPPCGSMTHPCPPQFGPEPCPCEPCDRDLDNSSPAAAGREATNSEAHKSNDKGQKGEQTQKESLHQLVYVPNHEKQEGATVTACLLGSNSEKLVTTVLPGKEKRDGAAMLLGGSGASEISEPKETSQEKQADEAISPYMQFN